MIGISSLTTYKRSKFYSVPVDALNDDTEILREQLDDCFDQGGQINDYRAFGGNPVRFVDPAGELQRNPDGSLKEDPAPPAAPDRTDPRVPGSNEHPVTLYTNDGNPIRAYKNTDPKGHPNVTDDCHGSTFADGKYWIDNDDVWIILKGDGYKEVPGGTTRPGDIVIYRDPNSPGHAIADNTVHSATVTNVDPTNNAVTVLSKPGVTPPPGNQVPVGPGPGTGWAGPDATAQYYRLPTPATQPTTQPTTRPSTNPYDSELADRVLCE